MKLFRLQRHASPDWLILRVKENITYSFIMKWCRLQVMLNSGVEVWLLTAVLLPSRTFVPLSLLSPYLPFPSLCPWWPQLRVPSSEIEKSITARNASLKHLHEFWYKYDFSQTSFKDLRPCRQTHMFIKSTEKNEYHRLICRDVGNNINLWNFHVLYP